jgi:hypothetical protein
MRGAGFKGITTDSTYDAWSPSRAYSHYHGGVRILSETASAKLATPITLKFDQLRPGEGYDPRNETPNFGPVWQGGEWHLRDITNHMTTAAFFLLKHAAQNREHWLQRFYEIEKEAVRPIQAGQTLAFTIPSLHDHYDTDRLINILHRGGVEISQVQSTTSRRPRAGGAGDYVIPLAQPYGGFAKALLAPRRYPDLRNEKGQPIAPYDVTAHTLSLLMNIRVTPATVLPRETHKLRDDQIPPIIDTVPHSLSWSAPLLPRVAVYKSYVPVIDEGWTRYVLEHNGLPYHSAISNRDVVGNLHSKFAAIIIPDQPRAAILNGHRPGTMPPEYTGGLGAEGVKALREFVEHGGTLVCLNRASDFAIEQFKLPLRDVVDGLPRTDFYVPGSILRIELDTTDPIAKGIPKESIAWVENSPVFEIKSDPLALLRVKIIARYPSDKDPLLSGWLLGGDRIKGKAALVEVGMGKGRIILFGFRPQYRGQSLATYPLFFNAISGK